MILWGIASTAVPSLPSTPPTPARHLGLRVFVAAAALVLVLGSFGAAALVANYRQAADDAIDGVARTARLAGALGSSLVTLARQELVVLGRTEAFSGGDPLRIQAAIELASPTAMGFAGGLWWVDAAGTVRAGSGAPDLLAPAAPVIVDALAAGRPHVETLSAPADPAVRPLLFVVPLTAPATGALVGVVELDSTNRDLVRSLFGTDAVMAVDETGRPVLGFDLDERERRLGALAAERAFGTGDGRVVDPRTFLDATDGVIEDAEGSVVAYSSPAGIDWVVVVQRPRDELFSPLKWQLERSSLALGLLIVASLLTAAFVSRRLQGVHRRETEAGQLFATVLQQLPVGVAALDRQGRVIVINDHADRALGTDHPIGSDAPPALDAALQALRRGETVADTDVTTGPEDGERSLVVRAAPVVTAGGVAGVAAIVEDVTERRERESRDRILAEATAGLAAAASREEVAAVVAGAAPAFGAVAAIVVLRDPLDPDQLLLSSVLGFGAADTAGWERIPLESETPVALACRLEREVFVTREDALELFPAMGHLFAESENEAWGALPLRSAGRVDGAIGLSFPHLADIAEGRRTQLVGFAAQVSQALDRASRRRIEHDVALVLQRGLLNAIEGAHDGVDLASRYAPAEDHLEVGGDFFDVIPLEDGSMLLVIGDLVGHGIEAASAMGQLRSATRALAATTSSPARLLELLDRFVAMVPACRFATVALVTVAPDRRHVRYSSAGHPPPVWVDADGATGLFDAAVARPLGVSPATRPEAVADVAGRTVCLYTDGLVERRGEVIDDGLARLVAAMADHHRSSTDGVVDGVLADVAGDGRQRDDIALLLARFDD